MLQYPINVYPDKVAFDSAKNTYDRNLHFTFKGDQLTCVFYRIYNYDTQEVVRYGKFHNPTFTPLAYNNETFNSNNNFLANLSKGKYILQMMFTETRTDVDNTGFLSAFDRYVSRGKTTLAHTRHTDTIRVEDRINVIYPWNKNGNVFSHTEENIRILDVNVTVRTTDMLMEMGGERVRIDSYNYETGEIELLDWFENNYPSGTPYRLYSNFLVTEQYYFEIAVEPVIQKKLRDEGLIAELEAQIAQIEDEIEEKGIDTSITVYGNIDMDNREILWWTAENLELYANEIESWNLNVNELAGTPSTVIGMSSEFYNVEVAFSPLLQTIDGAVLLSADVVNTYIYDLIDAAGESWTTEQLLTLDEIGLEYDGVLIQNLIADAGETAIATGEALHYVGAYGALSMTEDELREALNHTEWVSWDSHGGTFAGYFWQSGSALIQDGAGLKYFSVKLDKVQGSLSWNVANSGKIYSQDVEWKFTDDYDVASLQGGNYSSHEYRLTVDYVLQNGMTFTKEYSTIQPSRLNTRSVADVHFEYQNVNTVLVKWTEPEPHMDLSYRVYRINAEGLYNPNERQDKLHQSFANNPKKVLVADIPRNNGFNDYTIGSHKRVQYIVVPYEFANNAMNVYTATVSPVAETNFFGYTIMSIKDSGKNADGLPVYFKGDIWKFMADIQDTENVQNLNNVLHVGYGKYATSTSTDNDYMSGTLTACLGNMSCARKTFEDDIEVVQAWRRFIAQDCMFVLKSQKGDVWLVKIVDSTNTTYKESVTKIPVNFTFSWVECGNVDEILVVDELPYGCVDRK